MKVEYQEKFWNKTYMLQFSLKRNKERLQTEIGRRGGGGGGGGT